jgi:hypothetical protein
MADPAFLLVPAQAMVGAFLKTFEQLPPRQRPASFSIDQAIERAPEKRAQLEASSSGASGSFAAAHVPIGQKPACSSRPFVLAHFVALR